VLLHFFLFEPVGLDLDAVGSQVVLLLAQLLLDLPQF
jgi:hypothetical protein